jgi:hypothetical protein
MAFRRSVIADIEGFDPALGTGSPALAGSDVEAFSHAILRGSRLVYEPRSVCWHDHRATESAVKRQTFAYAVGFTAILTKWLFRDRRLLPLIIRQGLGVARRALFRRHHSGDVPHKVARLAQQVRMHRGTDTLIRQFGGYALGPVLYLKSILWVRRLGRRRALPEHLAQQKR